MAHHTHTREREKKILVRVPKVNLKAINKATSAAGRCVNAFGSFTGCIDIASLAASCWRKVCAVSSYQSASSWNESTVKSTFCPTLCVFFSFHCFPSMSTCSSFQLVFFSLLHFIASCCCAAHLHSRHQATCHLLTSRIGVH